MNVVTEEFWLTGNEAVVESCANCAHRVDNYCTNLDTKHYIEGGMVDKPLLKPESWKCPLYLLKASG